MSQRLFVASASIWSPHPPLFLENHSAPPDVTGYSSDSSHSHVERHHMSNMGTIARNTQKYGNAERMETGDGKRGLLPGSVSDRVKAQKKRQSTETL